MGEPKAPRTESERRGATAQVRADGLRRSFRPERLSDGQQRNDALRRPASFVPRFGVHPPVNRQRPSTSVWRLSGSIHLDRYSIHVAIVPHLVARDKACPLVVLALGDLHAIDGEEDILLAAERGNFAVVIHTLPTPYFSGHDPSRIAHSGTGVGPVDDRVVNQPRYPTGKLAGVICPCPGTPRQFRLVEPGCRVTNSAPTDPLKLQEKSRSLYGCASA